MRSLGWVSDRVPSSGAGHGKDFKGDVTLEKDGKKLKAEVKFWAKQFDSIYALYPGYAISVSSGESVCIISHDFNDLGFTGPLNYTQLDVVNGPKVRRQTIDKIMGLYQYVKECDFLAIKTNYKNFLFLRYYI